MKKPDVPTRIRNAYGDFAVIPTVLVRDPSLSDGAVRLYALLWDYSGEKDRDAWPKRSTMAEDLDVSVDTIDRRVKELVKRGAISVEPDFEGDRQVSNVYTILQLDPSEVIHRGRKFAAPVGAARLRHPGAANLRHQEQEPQEPENNSPVPYVTTDGGEAPAGTGQSITPKAISATHGQPLNTADVFAAVGKRLPSTFTDAMLEQLADEIIQRSASRVLDPTAYVIRALRARDLVDAGQWLVRADEIAAGIQPAEVSF